MKELINDFIIVARVGKKWIRITDVGEASRISGTRVTNMHETCWKTYTGDTLRGSPVGKL